MREKLLGINLFALLIIAVSCALLFAKHDVALADTIDFKDKPIEVLTPPEGMAGCTILHITDDGYLWLLTKEGTQLKTSLGGIETPNNIQSCIEELLPIGSEIMVDNLTDPEEIYIWSSDDLLNLQLLKDHTNLLRYSKLSYYSEIKNMI